MRKNREQGPIVQPALVLRGVQVFQSFLNRDAQETLLEEIRTVVSQAPLFSPMTPYGKKMSVQMTSAGQFGWVSDEAGYRYARKHPNGSNWADIPASVSQIWDAVSGADRAPELSLIHI